MEPIKHDQLLDYALEYASSTNAIENNELTSEEIMQIYKEIQSGKKDESFLYSLVKYMEERKNQKGEENAKHR